MLSNLAPITDVLAEILLELKHLNAKMDDVVDFTDKTVNRLDLILLDTTEIAGSVAGIAIESTAILAELTEVGIGVADIAINTTAAAATLLDVAANTTAIAASTSATAATMASILGVEGAILTSVDAIKTSASTLVISNQSISVSTSATYSQIANSTNPKLESILADTNEIVQMTTNTYDLLAEELTPLVGDIATNILAIDTGISELNSTVIEVLSDTHTLVTNTAGTNNALAFVADNTMTANTIAATISTNVASIETYLGNVYQEVTPTHPFLTVHNV